MPTNFPISATVYVLIVLILSAPVYCSADGPLGGTLVVAVPVREGLVVCSDKRLYNHDRGTFTDSYTKIHKVSDSALFVATNTIGFYDERTKTMAFNAFDVTVEYVSKHDLNTGKPFWDGLKKEITARLRAYFSSRPYNEWPPSDSANQNLLFNLVFYSVRDGKAWSHSLKVFYEKARTPVILIPDPVREHVRTPKLAGKGREVMNYLARNPSVASNPLINRFDETSFDLQTTTAPDAVRFAGRLFQIASTGVPQARVSATYDCALIATENGFQWLPKMYNPI